VVDTLEATLTLFTNSSVFTLGQNNVFAGALLCNNNVTADIKAGLNVACAAPALT
jgi:hypothetical protein